MQFGQPAQLGLAAVALTVLPDPHTAWATTPSVRSQQVQLELDQQLVGKPPSKWHVGAGVVHSSDQVADLAQGSVVSEIPQHSVPRCQLCQPDLCAFQLAVSAVSPQMWLVGEPACPLPGG